MGVVWLRTKGVHVPKCILIVDESIAIRKILRETFEREADWEVCGEASNGREGIEKAQQLRPDLTSALRAAAFDLNEIRN